VEPLVAGLIFVAVLLALTWFQHRLSRGRMWHPLWLAFSMTFAAALFVVAGAIGYRLDRRLQMTADSRWVESVIWWQVALGVVFATLAVIFWRMAIRETDRLIGRMEARTRGRISAES
jgi:hypothetical protein